MIHYITTNGVGNAWVGNELRQVLGAGVPVALHALRRPEVTFFKSDWAQDLHEGTESIYPIPPLRLAASILAAPFRFRGRFFSALGNALFGPRESMRIRLKTLGHFFVACDWATRLRRQGRQVSAVHSQWIHSSGSVGMYGAWLLGAPFSFTGHATDLFRDRCALLDKVRRADLIVCISEFHRDFFRKHGAREEQMRVVYCGIDPSHFAPRADGPAGDGRLRVRSSGRLVEKKGFADLVRACAILRARGVDLECVIAGSGPLERELRALVEREGMGAWISITGEPLKQEDIPAFMHGGDVYCLPCVWASDNDVDGLPQMLMEAMACGLPVVSTRLVGIPDLVIHEKTGLLVEPNRPEALADALQRLGADAGLRWRLARDGRAWVEEAFDINTCLEPLIEAFREFEERSTGRAPAAPPPVARREREGAAA